MDQLDRAYLALKGKPDSRQVVLQIWDAQLDMPDVNGAAVNSDIPCNVLSMLKVRNGKLEWMQILRSNDIFIGLPHNFVQFTFLQEILAGWLDVELGSYNQISDSLHLYDEKAENIRKSAPLPSIPQNTDTIAVDKESSESAFSELFKRSERLIRGGLVEADIRRLATWPEAPIGFQNILRVLTAEAARRMSYPALSRELMTKCNNPILVHLWERWYDHVNSLVPT